MGAGRVHEGRERRARQPGVQGWAHPVSIEISRVCHTCSCCGRTCAARLRRAARVRACCGTRARRGMRARGRGGAAGACGVDGGERGAPKCFPKSAFVDSNGPSGLDSNGLCKFPDLTKAVRVPARLHDPAPAPALARARAAPARPSCACSRPYRHGASARLGAVDRRGPSVPVDRGLDREWLAHSSPTCRRAAARGGIAHAPAPRRAPSYPTPLPSSDRSVCARP
jgi:hypothetical protein